MFVVTDVRCEVMLHFINTWDINDLTLNYLSRMCHGCVYMGSYVPPKKHQGIGVRRTFRYFVRALTRALKAASFLRLSVWQTLICCTLCSLYRIPTKSSIAEAVTKESRWERSLVPNCSITIWGANDSTTVEIIANSFCNVLTPFTTPFNVGVLV